MGMNLVTSDLANVPVNHCISLIRLLEQLRDSYQTNERRARQPKFTIEIMQEMKKETWEKKHQ